MKKLFTMFAAALLMAVGLGSCSEYDDSELKKAIEDLKDEHEQMKEQIDAQSALLNALANKLTITSVTEVENGYTITFSDNSTITITNGENGKDGENITESIVSISITETEVVFELANGDVVSIPLAQQEEGTVITNLYYYCDYWGDLFSADLGTYNYYIVLSDQPLEDGWFASGSCGYCFDLYSAIAAEDNNNTLPNGTYTFDVEASMVAGTIADGMSAYVDENEDMYLFEDATIVVSDNKLVATVVLNGETIVLKYEGSLALPSEEEEGGGDEETLSNLTSNLSFDISGGSSLICNTFFGDWYEIGYNNYYVQLFEDAQTFSGVYIMLDLFTTATSTNICNVYTPYFSSSITEYTFIEGLLDDDGYLAGSWYTTISNGEFTSTSQYAPLTAGAITIEEAEEEGYYTVSLTCFDDAGNKIEGTFTAPYEYEDYSDAAYVASPNGAQKANFARKAPKGSVKMHNARPKTMARK